MLTRMLRVSPAPLWRHARRHGEGSTCTTFRAQGSAMSFRSSPIAQDKTNEGSATARESRASALEAFRNIVVSRTAANSFSDKQVEEGVLRDIMALTQSAPSSFNLQPWSVVLVREPAARERLATAMMGANSKKVMAAPVTAVFCADLEPSKRIHRMSELNREAGMAEADVAKLSFAVNLFSGGGTVGNVLRNAVTKMASPMQPAPEVGSAEAWSFKNTALAAQTFILSCEAHGLATSPMEGFDARRIRAVLDVPDRYGIPMVVCTGYPAPSKAGEGEGIDTGAGAKGKRWRYPAEEVVFDGAFGVGMTGIDPVVP